MKAWIIDSFDGIEKSRMADVPEPRPAAGEVVLRVMFAGLNPADAYLARRMYPARPPLPHVLGRDAIGTVEAIGPEVANLPIGKKQVILRGDTGVTRWGTFAQRAAVAADSLVDVPPGWSDEQAGGATLVYLTAYQALTQWPEIASGAVVLISGASGGVGVAATQLAVAMKHIVIGLSRSSEKREKLKALGITLALDPSSPNWRDELQKFLGQKKVNLVIDTIGGSLFSEMIATLGDHGRLSVVGRLAGEVPQFNTSTLIFRRIRIGGVAVSSFGSADGRIAWGNVVRLLAETGAKPVIDQVFPFEQLPTAFARLASGPMGKVLLKI